MVISKGRAVVLRARIFARFEIANPEVALGRLDEDERHGVSITDPIGKSTRKPTFYQRGQDVFALIMQSRKPEAKAFKKWVTSEVLPSIHGITSRRQPSSRARSATPSERSYLKALSKYITEEDIYKVSKKVRRSDSRPERAERFPSGQRRDACLAAGPRFGQQEPMGGRLFSGQDGRGALRNCCKSSAMNNTRRKSLQELIEKQEGLKLEIEPPPKRRRTTCGGLPKTAKGRPCPDGDRIPRQAMTAAGDVIENLTSAAE